MAANREKNRGFTLIELVVGIVVLAVLATGFLSAFSAVMKTSVSPLQIAAMEDIAASQMNYLLFGTFQSAVNASGTIPFNVDGTEYFATFESSAISGVSVASGVHVGVTVSCHTCGGQKAALYGDSYDVQ